MPENEPRLGNAWKVDAGCVTPKPTNANDEVDLRDERREKRAAARAMAEIRKPEPD